MSGIVTIENDLLMGSLLEEYLTGAGYPARAGALHEAPAGDKADLVIIDVYMPRHAGREMIWAAKTPFTRDELLKAVRAVVGPPR